MRRYVQEKKQQHLPLIRPSSLPGVGLDFGAFALPPRRQHGRRRAQRVVPGTRHGAAADPASGGPARSTGRIRC